MATIYDNWERLVRATLSREQLRLSALRTPSDLSVVSSSSSFNSSVSSRRVPSFSFPGLLVGEKFEYNQILRATDYFGASNLMRHGRSGDFFSGVLEDGTPVVVKRIEWSSAQNESYCISELEFFGKASHSRLVPLLGHCLELLDEKYLVYKYMPNRDLSSTLSLEVRSDGDRQLKSLDWMTRLKIATGAAEALCYLHDECVPSLVHRDIQASSILLDHGFEVRLGSCSEVCAEEREMDRNIIAKLMGLPLEYRRSPSGTTPNASCAYDVYCFGKVLLELVTGKLGISASSDAATKEWLEQTLPYISIYDKELVTRIIDPSLIIDDDLLEKVWAMAIVARLCLYEPSVPLRMRDILKELEDLLKVVVKADRKVESGLFWARNPASKITGAGS